MANFCCIVQKIDTAEESFSHHHFPRSHAFGQIFMSERVFIALKLNLMIDDDVYTMRSRLFIW
jgi:hypothetical protein